MNESGRAVEEAAHFYKIGLDDIVVFHDELDLPPGKLRIKIGGGVAGHNGLRSISAHLGNDYRRVRIGIGHPGVKELVHSYVLSDFAKSEKGWVETLCEAIADNAALLAKGRGFELPEQDSSGDGRRRVSASMRRTTKNKVAAPRAARSKALLWDSNAASSDCRMSASRRSSMR